MESSVKLHTEIYQTYNFRGAQIKQASINLAKMYMKRVKIELDSIRSSDKESNQESLLLQGVHFAYRTHQVRSTQLS